MKEHQTLRAILKSHDLPLVLSTLCMKKGPSYRGVGARMVSDGNKILSGSISGGCIEGDLPLKMKEVLKTGQSQLIPYDLSNDAVDPFGYGMGCDGTFSVLLQGPLQYALYCQSIDLVCEKRESVCLTTNLMDGPSLGEQKVYHHKPDELPGFLYEEFHPQISLILFGGGRDVEPLVALAGILGWHVYLTDYRKGYLLEKLQSPWVTTIHGSIEQIMKQISFDSSTAFVSMTHQLEKDTEMVSKVMETQCFYIGLMGHRDRLKGLSGTVLKQDSRFYSPIGLDLGAKEPSEIALSLCSEILALYNDGKGIPLSNGSRTLS